MASFFAAELGALASLTGFVVVAISINLARILSYPAAAVIDRGYKRTTAICSRAR
ncbi:MAG TPA: hypothetical protein VKA12_11505 [Roseiarcus sp.]|nr:hypothetical protein [Roseiarcus sp.]